jgi:hypothetical protein
MAYTFTRFCSNRIRETQPKDIEKEHYDKSLL